MTSRRIRINGFTLIEMLVVVAILVLLIALLVPGLATARMLATRAVCLSNLRGCGAGFNMYGADNNNNIFLCGSGSTGGYGNYVGWPLAVAYGCDGSYTPNKYPSYVDPRIVRCPLDPGFKGISPSHIPAWSGSSNNDNLHWSAYAVYSLSTEDGNQRGWSFEVGCPAAPLPFGNTYSFAIARLHQVPQPSGMVLLGDSYCNYYYGGAPTGYGPDMQFVFSDTQGAGYWGDSAAWTAHGTGGAVAVTGDFHGSLPVAVPGYNGAKCNMSFFDGHAESRGVQEMRNGLQPFQMIYDRWGNWFWVN
jgi:prepilin-type N-terminal cleavage/methylation domain-containing protein/prepilin-type processing-associated H-X9-DG protein